MCKCNTKSNFFSKDVFLKNLREIRGKRSQKEMAEIAGLKGQQYWQRLESGATEPNLAQLVDLSVRLNKPVGVLLGVEKESPASEFVNDQSLIDGIRTFRKEMEMSIARANTFLDSLTKIEKKISSKRKEATK